MLNMTSYEWFFQEPFPTIPRRIYKTSDVRSRCPPGLALPSTLKKKKIAQVKNCFWTCIYLNLNHGDILCTGLKFNPFSLCVNLHSLLTLQLTAMHHW
jgi:hypothetical protein